jgi:P27 family predicted phage terminase small subunit
MPSTLSREAKAEWRRVVPVLESRGVLSPLHRTGLTILVMSWAEMQELDRAIANEKSGSLAWRRLCVVRGFAFSRWSTLSARFGLTPADRARLKPTATAGTKRKTARFFWRA